MSFGSIISNEKTLEAIKKHMTAGRFPQSVILCGDSGSGKRLLADACAAVLICGDTAHVELTGDSCGVCPACRKAAERNHPDIIYFGEDAESDRSFHVETIRELTDGLYLVPNEAEYKVYILENAHNMTVNAQNALLKSLEEPPRFVRFILLAEDPDSLAETICSRSVIYTMQYVSEAAVSSYLSSAYPSAETDAIRRATSLSAGSIGSAINILTNDDEYDGLCLTYLRCLSRGDIYPIFRELSAITERSVLMQFYSRLEYALHDIAAAKAVPGRIPAFFKENEIQTLSGAFTVDKILRLFDKTANAKRRLIMNINVRISIFEFLS